MQLTKRYVFDHVEIITGERRVVVDGRTVSVGSRAFSVLLALVENRDRVVSNDELLAAAWPNVVVEQNNLAVQISALRRALGRHTITNVPGRGYKFSAVATPAEKDKAPVALPMLSASRRAAAAAELPDHRGPLLVGREDDLKSVGELIARHRIVTLVGPTGIGKTRLARQLAADATHRHAHGSVWVEVPATCDKLVVVDVIARALQIDLREDDPLASLVRALQPLHLLLVIDNADAVVHEVARIVQALAEQAPGLSLLLTSQMPMHLSDEKAVMLNPLAVPPAGTKPVAALQYGAVALFVQRASAADSRFALSGDNVAEVINVCRSLDGIPLAIDMAASLTTLLGVGELSDMMSRRLRLLSSNRRDAPERHQTLRRAMEWSYGLLDQRDQVVLRRLSIFSSGFTLELALQVATSDDALQDEIDQWAVVDALTELTHRALVIADSNEPPRYRLLESTRLFAREQLANASEEEICRRRHALATRDAVIASFDSRFRDWDLARSQVTVELDNAREAFVWALAHDAPSAVQLAPVIYWALPTGSAAGLDMWAATERLLSPDLPLRVRAQWATSASDVRHGVSPHWRLEWARTAVSLWRSTGDREGLQVALMSLAWLEGLQDRAARARLLEEVHALDTPEMSPGVRTLQASLAAKVALDSGDLEAAVAAYEYALRSAVTSRNSDAQDALLTGIARAEHMADRLDDAVRHGHQLVARFRGTRKAHWLGTALCYLAAACLSSNDHASARAALAEAWPLACVYGRSEDCCDGFVLVCALEGRHEIGALLRGFVDAMRERSGQRRNSSMEMLAQRAESLLLEALGMARLAQLRDRGRSLSPGDVASWVCETPPPLPTA